MYVIRLTWPDEYSLVTYKFTYLAGSEQLADVLISCTKQNQQEKPKQAVVPFRIVTRTTTTTLIYVFLSFLRNFNVHLHGSIKNEYIHYVFYIIQMKIKTSL